MYIKFTKEGGVLRILDKCEGLLLIEDRKNFKVEENGHVFLLTQNYEDAMEFYLAEKEKAVPAPTGTDKNKNYPVRV